MIRLEVCVDSVAGCDAAKEAGADRVELCAGLIEGGTTPSAGALEAACEVGLPVVCLVRPRGGDFLYDAFELDAMRRDVEHAKRAGASGVALGCLRADGTVDAEPTAELIARARPLEVCFHRAFDLVREPLEALEVLAELGVDRVLTSGQSPNVAAGLERLAALVDAAGDRLSIMPGGGVREHNVRRVIDATGVREVHFTARTARESLMTFRNRRVRMSSSEAPREYELQVTDPDRVRRFVAAARNAGAGPE